MYGAEKGAIFGQWVDSVILTRELTLTIVRNRLAQYCYLQYSAAVYFSEVHVADYETTKRMLWIDLRMEYPGTLALRRICFEDTRDFSVSNGVRDCWSNIAIGSH